MRFTVLAALAVAMLAASALAATGDNYDFLHGTYTGWVTGRVFDNPANPNCDNSNTATCNLRAVITNTSVVITVFANQTAECYYNQGRDRTTDEVSAFTIQHVNTTDRVIIVETSPTATTCLRYEQQSNSAVLRLADEVTVNRATAVRDNAKCPSEVPDGASCVNDNAANLVTVTSVTTLTCESGNCAANLGSGASVSATCAAAATVLAAAAAAALF